MPADAFYAVKSATWVIHARVDLFECLVYSFRRIVHGIEHVALGAFAVVPDLVVHTHILSLCAYFSVNLIIVGSVAILFADFLDRVKQ